MTKPSAPTKAELHEMLAEAVRNTQPQPVRNEQPAPKEAHTDRRARKRPQRTRTEAHGQNEKRSGIWSQQVAASIARGNPCERLLLTSPRKLRPNCRRWLGPKLLGEPK